MVLLSKIFNWIVLSSIMGSFLVGAILIVKLILKNKQSAFWHYYIWMILIIRLTIPYYPQSTISIFNIFNLIKNNISHSAVKAETNTIVESGKENKIISTNVITDKKSKIKNVVQNTSKVTIYKGLWQLNKFMLLWLLGCILISMYIVFINLRLLFKIKKQQEIEIKEIRDIIEECKSVMNINRDIKVVFTDVYRTPSLFGILTLKLLLPSDISNKVSSEEMKHIILHELCHIKREDNITNWLIVTLKVLYWFNPIIWYGFYRMHEDSEIACDALALSYMTSEEQMKYGYTILHLIKMTSNYRFIPGTSGMLTDKSKIERRISMILLFNKKTIKNSIIGAVVLVVLGGVLLTGAKNVKAGSNVSKSVSIMQDTNITLCNVEEKNFKGKIITISNGKKVAVGYSLKDSKPDKTTSEIAKENDALAAINAGMFKIAESDKLDVAPVGFIIKDGKIVYNDLKNEDMPVDIACVTDKGELIVGKHSLAELKNGAIKDGVQSGPALIINGTPSIKNGDGGMGIGPRTAIAQKKDGTVILLVIDGRSMESIGASIKDIQDILLKYEAYNATLLDGGSSSTMYYDGNVINHPASLNGERIIPSIFILHK